MGLSLGAAWVRPQSPGPADAISREFVFSAGFGGPEAAISREFTFGVGFSGPSSAISREFSFSVGPDLRFDLAGTFLPTQGNAAQPFQVTWRVENVGNQTAMGVWKDRVDFNPPLQQATGGTVDFADENGPASLAPGASYSRTRTFTLPATPTTFSIRLITDVADVVGEGSNVNNTYDGPQVTVVDIPRPNLRTQFTSVPPATPTAGTPVAFSARVWNNGQAATPPPAWTERVFLVPDVNDDGIPPPTESGGTALWSGANLLFLNPDPGGSGGLPGTTYEHVAIAVMLPSSVEGPHFLAVRTDANQNQIESDEGDNLAFSGVFEVLPAPRPDLEVSNVDLPGLLQGTSLLPGEAYTVEWLVANRGTALFKGGGVSTEVWLSSESNVSGPSALDPASNLKLVTTSSALPPLAPDQATLASATVFLPPDLLTKLPPGPYAFKVRVDALDTVLEEESMGVPPYWNNLAVDVGTYPVVATPTPDLVPILVELVAGQPPPSVGFPVQVRWTVENAGTPGWDIPLFWSDQLWLSPGNETLGDGNDQLLKTFQESTVLVGGDWSVVDYTKTATVVLSESLAAGTYYFVLVADAGGSVYELGADGNNVKASPPIPVVREPADLVLEPSAAGGLITPSTSGAPGQLLKLAWTVRNELGAGPTSVSSWIDRFYLSPSPSDLVGAQTLMSVTHTGTLAPGELYDDVKNATVPFVSAGTWYLHMVTDVNGAVFEDDTVDNRVVLPFEVTGVVADLVVDQVSASQTTRPGDVVTVEWAVSNQGPAATGVSAWTDRVYLSETASLDPQGAIWSLGGAFHAASLGAGASYVANGVFQIPQGVPPGAWYVVVAADDGSQVFELDDGNNTFATRTLVELEPPPAGSGGGGSGGGTGWLPANLVARNVVLPSGTITAGQVAQIQWEVVNEGPGPTNLSFWQDRLYLSSDDTLSPGTDLVLGLAGHSGLLDVGEVRPMSEPFIVPLSANGAWKVLVDTDATNGVYQGGAFGDDVAVSAGLMQVVAPPLTNLAVSGVSVPATALLGAPFEFAWTTTNDSPGTIPASWDWTCDFWLMPAGVEFPSTDARFVGRLPANAGVIAGSGGWHVQNSSTTLPTLYVPGLPPGAYELVAIVDSQLQIAEDDEADNVSTSVASVTLEATEIASGGSVLADVPNGQSRWYRLIAPQGQTIDLEFEHDDPSAQCELFVREKELPSIGVYDLASDGLASVEPYKQSVRIPVTSGEDYYVMARTVYGAGTAGARLDAIPQPFEVEDVVPPAVGAGGVTVTLLGGQLWRATGVELRAPEGGPLVAVAEEIVDLVDGSLLARFDLTGVSPSSVEVVAVDADSSTEAAWSGLLVIESPLPLTLRAEVELAPTTRKGDTGSGTLRWVNAGNVDIPFAVVALGHLRLAADSPPEESVVVWSQALGIDQPDSDGLRDSLVLIVEDLGPGRSESVAVQVTVGGQYPLEEASFGLAGTPHSLASFLSGPFPRLSEGLRVAVAASPETPALLTSAAASPSDWADLVDDALASGSIALNLGTLHVPGAPIRATQDLLAAIAAGIEAELNLPAGASVPTSAIFDAAAGLPCYAFASGLFDCDALHPAECGINVEVAQTTTLLGAAVSAATACIGTPTSDDPNEKIYPKGIGPKNMVSANKPIDYEIHFENQASAGAWVSKIEILDRLEPGFVLSSVRFHELRIGAMTLKYDAALNIQETVPLPDAQNPLILCQITAFVDALSRELTVLLQAIDPLTGLPSSLADVGLLPPSSPGSELEAGGYVAFSVEAGGESSSLGPNPPVSAQRKVNSSSIGFDSNAKIITNTTENTLDAKAPASVLSGFLDDDVIQLSWSADDTESLAAGLFEGSGVKSFNLYVRPPGAATWGVLVSDTLDLAFEYAVGDSGDYAFKLEATDGVGNSEAKAEPDLIVTKAFDCNDNGVPDEDDIAAGTSLDCDGSGVPDECELADGTLQDLNANGVPDVCECVVATYCTATPNSTGAPAVISGSGLPSIGSDPLQIQVAGLPAGFPGLFIYSAGQQQFPFGDGLLCISPPIVRLLPLSISTAQGTASFNADFTSPAFTSGQVPVAAGMTIHFQYWYRDPLLLGGTGFNLTDGLSVTLCD